MEIVGIDVGYSFTKTSTGMIFPSKITTVEPMLGYSRTLYWHDTLYYVGTGSGSVAMNKTNEEVTSVLCLYALCGAAQERSVRVVVGLPVGHYKAQREALAAATRALSGAVEYDGVEIQIEIEDVAVYPQGLLPIDGDYVSVDIGGCTVDIIYVEQGEVKYAKTLYTGMQSLHGKIMDAINEKYESKLDDEYAHRVLTEGLFVRGKRQDMAFLKPIYQEHVESIIQEINKSTPAKMASIYLTGGGAPILFDAIQEKLDVELWNESQFSNAEMYRMVGEDLWP
jgi:plasmid segregation protein ParM